MPPSPPFSLSVQSFTPPTIPDQPADAKPSDFRSPLLASSLPATSPLYFTLALPNARDNNPLYPASHLHLSFLYEGSGEILNPDPITSKDLVKSATETEPNLYDVQVHPDDLPRAKVNQGTTSTAEVIIYAWKGEKLLGKWDLGRIENLGLVGLKSGELALKRQAVSDERRALRKEREADS